MPFVTGPVLPRQQRYDSQGHAQTPGHERNATGIHTYTCESKIFQPKRQ
jgi:hypothetical protein